MPYYMGDYYEGDYYEGDPGFWGLAVRAVTGLGRLGRAQRAVRGIVTSGAATAGRAIERVKGVVAQHPVLTAAGAAGAAGAGIGVGMQRTMGGPLARVGMMPGGLQPKGYHMSKPQRIPKNPAPHLVRNRRMRVTNPRALRRAIRRAAGFARMARRVMRFTSPRPPRGRAYFRPRRRKK